MEKDSTYKEPNINPKLLKPYDPIETEARIYEKWEVSGFFNPDICVEKGITSNDAKPFTIIMPPPNANGSLHVGHAVFVTIEDLMIRYKRMQGYKALWLPGADHAGFETQVVYEKKLEKEGRSRFGMDPEILRKEIMDFTLYNKQFMEGQLRKLGASCDWSREKFTLDNDIVDTVYDTFKTLSDDNLVYRGKKIVNWCPKHQTSLSELETENSEEKSPFYYFKYGPFTIGTVRPETKFGDKYVVMHPDDARFSQYKHGDTFETEWINGPITATIIKDESVDPEFGTGVMTITPWHSGVDFDIAKKYNLDVEQVIDWQGKLLPIAGEFAGIKINQAREKIVEKLKDKGLLIKIDTDYKNVLKKCYKCGSSIEPQIKDQWFIKMKPLAEKALEVIKKDEIKFYPENYKKIMTHWLENIEDWNISRQIVWGITIPAWYKDGEIKISKENPGSGWVAETDTFDTWFSSGQWPFATLGYPDKDDFKNFYPTQVMETAGEIIFFWVARMIMLGIYRTGKIPFDTVYLHGLIVAKDGKKMSKSKGNVISPIEVSDKYGTDALRMALIIGNTPGTSTALFEDKIKAYKHFSNKLWNITRFILTYTEGMKLDENFADYTDTDKKLIEERNDLIKTITKEIEDYKFYLAGEKLYQYAWTRFADVILEESRAIFADGTTEEKNSRAQFLLYTLEIIIKALHPFMPFITEEIWNILHENKENSGMIMVSKWPQIPQQ